MSKKVAVILSGCGVYDGAEIQESVYTLLALDQEKAAVTCFAPDLNQAHVVNHRTGESTANETRNVLTESARIARGAIAPLASLQVEEFDAVILPGGFGAAKNLCDYAFSGTDLRVLPELTNILKDFHKADKPIGFICIAPVIAAAVFGNSTNPPELTIGTDEATGDHLQTLGAKSVSALVEDIVIDQKNKIVTTPAYMLGTSPAPVFTGIQKLVKSVLSLS